MADNTRAKVVQFLHTVNVFVFAVTGIGLLFFTDKMVPGVNQASLASVKGNGSFSLVYGLLLSTLGWTHHGAYCLTMTLHFCLMTVNTLDVIQQKLPDGSFDSRLALQAGFNYVMFFLMITILITGGIGTDHSPAGKAGKAGGNKSY
jgi:hypothetical protein